MIQKEKKRIERKGRNVDRELNISRECMQPLFKNKLGLKPLKFQKRQNLTNDKK